MGQTTTDILDIDATYHRPGAIRLAADLGVRLATPAAVTCGQCGGPVLPTAGTLRCMRCGDSYGPATSDDDAGDLLATRGRPDRFEQF